VRKISTLSQASKLWRHKNYTPKRKNDITKIKVALIQFWFDVLTFTNSNYN